MPGWGTAIGGALGGLVGYFGSDNGAEVDDARQKKEELSKKIADQYLSYRDTVNEAYMKQAAGANSFYDVNSNMLNSMNGGQGAPDIAGGVYTSPIKAEGMKDVSIPSSSPTFAPGTPMPSQNAPKTMSYMPQRTK
jgi:hypothetical protein